MFQTTYQQLSNELDWGQVALLPWDSDIFGFPVGEFRMGDASAIANHLDDFRAAYARWAGANQVELAACSIPVDDAPRRAVMSSLNFEYVDTTLEAMNHRVQKTDLPKTHMLVRDATLADKPRVEEIAEHAFRYGRYHADFRFPVELANKRYRVWLNNAFKTLGPTSHIYVVESAGKVNGFFHTNIVGEQGNMTILAIDPAARGARTTMDFTVGCFQKMKDYGLRRIQSKISAANIDIGNILIYFGFHFGHPQALYHWHAPNAPHLRSWKEMFAEPARAEAGK
ncbi:MAG TPA: hypothetical protein VIX58_03550 [Anaerolineae bacterium]